MFSMARLYSPDSLGSSSSTKNLGRWKTLTEKARVVLCSLSIITRNSPTWARTVDMSKYILAAASVLFGAGTMMLLVKTSKVYSAPILEQCLVPNMVEMPTNQLPPFYRTGLPVIDHIGCFFTFLDARSTDLNLFVTRALMGPGMAFFTIAAIESTRSTSRAFARWYMATALVSQALGVCVASLLIWLPSWLLTGTSPSKHAPLRSGLVWTIALLLVVPIGSMLVMLEGSTDIDVFGPAVLVFTYAPILMPLVWVPVGALLYAMTGPLHRMPYALRSGSHAAHIVYEILSIIAAVYWVYALWMWLSPLGVLPPSILTTSPSDLVSWLSTTWSAETLDTSKLTEALEAIVQMITQPTGTQVVGLYLGIDHLVVWIALIWWAAIEDGIFALPRIIVGGVVFGPGASILSYAARREVRLGGLSRPVDLKTKME
ncbi:hypothetical protein BASA50_003878 [Batrachochytrium salamandrivorans]|uniref:Uncharacterized protein n=1 Tax=Batrachochytrium salamandrivorans TaxID=1357716 RepID=A0ABQ8FIJ2_9FUNG|nr:hypothetical protein BASA50_003878 [Batrachochytrium salamandrivorans]KAH9246483.1 hypothetical protein BASA81_015963 [Batrachochytrium salamandrivorans]